MGRRGKPPETGTFAWRLTDSMERKGNISPTQLAELVKTVGLVEIQPNTISRWRNSRQTPKDSDTLQALATALEVPLNWLKTGEGDVSSAGGSPMPSGALEAVTGRPGRLTAYEVERVYDESLKEIGIKLARGEGFKAEDALRWIRRMLATAVAELDEARATSAGEDTEDTTSDAEATSEVQDDATHAVEDLEGIDRAERDRLQQPAEGPTEQKRESG